MGKGCQRAERALLEGFGTVTGKGEKKGGQKTTVALTILGGLALLVFGQIVIRSFVDPIYEIHKLRGEIADVLIYHGDVYMNPRKWNRKNEAAAHALKSLASQLRAKCYAVPFYQLFAFIRAVPPPNDIVEVINNLIALSNSLYEGQAEENGRRREKIKQALKLKDG